MAFSPPSSPTNGDTYQYLDTQYVYQNGLWMRLYSVGYDVPIAIPFPTFEETVRDNCAELDGATLVDGEADYPLVAQILPWLVVSGGDIDLPDMRGVGIRGFDNGAGTDPDAASRTARAGDGATGDKVGTEQADAAPELTGNFWVRPDNGGAAIVGGHGGVFDTYASGSVGRLAIGTASVAAPDFCRFTASNGNAKYGAGTDVRGANIAVLWQMRLF